MAVQRVNFTSDNLLLNNMKTISQQPVQMVPASKVESEANSELSAVEDVSAKNHKVRNWTIGLSAAAVLTALGVLSGRKGYLGEGVQKFLGGMKNKAGELTDDIGCRGEELVDDVIDNVKPKVPDANPVKPGTPEVIEPEVFGLETRVPDSRPTGTKSETVEVAGKPETSAKPEVKPTISHKVDVDGINARIDRTLPNLDDVPEKIEVSDFSQGANKHISVKKENREILYNSKGELVSITEYTEVGNLSRCINFEPGTKNVSSMSHVEGVFFVKRDVYKDGKVVEEQFFDPSGTNIIETIKH